MGNMVTNICAKSNYDRLRTDKALGFRKSDNKNKNKMKSKNNVRGDWESLPGPTNMSLSDIADIVHLQKSVYRCCCCCCCCNDVIVHNAIFM